MSCYLCGSMEYSTRPGSVRDNDGMKVLECEQCGLVYLSSLEHISEEHYENSGMHDGLEPDVRAWLKETQADDERRYQFLKEHMTNKNVLDFGCGIAGFLERSMKSARKVAGIELETALQTSFQSRGLNVYSSLQSANESDQKWDLITAFHVVEHLSDPVEVLKELSNLLSRGGEIIVEVPSSEDALLILYENQPFQNFTYWSQHLFLFNARTMQDLVEKAGLKLNWIKHVQRFPLSNHLYWLTHGKPGGHKLWSFLNSKSLNEQYEHQLASLGLTDTIIVGISV